ncbi:uncharacterized [Tachysurus ichikawai]
MGRYVPLSGMSFAAAVRSRRLSAHVPLERLYHMARIEWCRWVRAGDGGNDPLFSPGRVRTSLDRGVVVKRNDGQMCRRV